MAVALVAGMTLRVGVVVRKDLIEHDEAVSYLAATGHQKEWAQVATDSPTAPAALAGRWLEARTWKRLIRPEPDPRLATIRYDLARTDLHPPLYFWLLGSWMRLVGVGPATGPALNALLSLLVMGAMFGLGRTALGDDLDSAAAVLVWAASPSALAGMMVARQYELAALLTVLLAWAGIRMADPDRTPAAWEYALLAAVFATGTLTHYYFPLAAAGVGLVVAARTLRRGWRRSAAVVASLGVGLAVFWALHPDFVLSIAKQSSRGGVFAARTFAARLEKAKSVAAGFVFPERFVKQAIAAAHPTIIRALSPNGRWMLAAVLGAAVVALAAILSRRRVRDALVRFGGGLGPDGRGVGFLALWLAGFIFTMYLAYRSPAHAMAPRYLAMAWPLVAFLPVLVARVLPRAGVWLVLAYVGLVFLVPGLAGLAAPRRQRPEAAIGRARRVVTDNLARGVLPRVFIHMPDRAELFAASQKELLAHPEKWLGSLEEGDLVVSCVSYESTREGREALLALIESRHEVRPLTRSPLAATSIWAIDGPSVDGSAGPGSAAR